MEMALKKETDTLSKERLEAIQKELADLRDKFNAMKAQWESEKAEHPRRLQIQRRRSKKSRRNRSAQRIGDYETAAKLKYSRLPELQKKLDEAQKNGGSTKHTLLRDTVTEEEIARVVSRWTGIPLAKLMEGEREKILHLDDILHKRVIGQNEAVTKVTEAIIRSRAGHRGSQPPYRFLPLPRPHGRRQNGTCKSARRKSVRR